MSEEDGSEPLEHGQARPTQPRERLVVALSANQVKHLDRERLTAQDPEGHLVLGQHRRKFGRRAFGWGDGELVVCGCLQSAGARATGSPGTSSTHLHPPVGNWHDRITFAGQVQASWRCLYPHAFGRGRVGPLTVGEQFLNDTALRVHLGLEVPVLESQTG